MRWSIVLVVALWLASPAVADYTFGPGSPANGSTISYNDWYSAGSYVTFTVTPDPNYPCGTFNIYFLEINGVRVGQFSNNCSITTYLPSPGRYSWRTILYVFNTATTVTGSTIYTVTIGAPGATPTPPPAPVATPSPSTTTTEDTTEPSEPEPTVRAIGSSAHAGRKTTLKFSASDYTSGKSDVTVWIEQKGRIIWEVDRNIALSDSAATYTNSWLPKKQGGYRVCVTATDQNGDASKTSCAAVTVR